MTNQVSGQFAQFLSYCEEFHVEPEDDSDEAQKTADTKITIMAKAWINTINAEFSPEPINKGAALKKVYSRSTKPFYNKAGAALNKQASKLFKSKIGDDISELYTSTIDEIKVNASKNSVNFADKLVTRIIKEKGDGYLYVLKVLYGAGSESIHLETQHALNQSLEKYTKEFIDNIELFQRMFEARNKTLSSIVNMASQSMGLDTLNPSHVDEIPNPIKDGRCADAEQYAAEHDIDLDTINLYSRLYMMINIVYENLYQNDAVLEEINYRIDKVANKNIKPPSVTIEDEVKASVEYVSNMKTLICDM
jgi:hypothetical protein